MANRTARYQKPGDRNLRGRRTRRTCPCCDPIINHREKILEGVARQEIREVSSRLQEIGVEEDRTEPSTP